LFEEKLVVDAAFGQASDIQKLFLGSESFAHASFDSIRSSFEMTQKPIPSISLSRRRPTLSASNPVAILIIQLNLNAVIQIKNIEHGIVLDRILDRDLINVIVW